MTEYTQEFTGKEVEGGAEGQEPEVKFRMPKDDRNWLTESRAQFTEKSTKMVDPYKAVHQTESKDTPLNMPKDDRDWVTENRRGEKPRYEVRACEVNFLRIAIFNKSFTRRSLRPAHHTGSGLASIRPLSATQPER